MAEGGGLLNRYTVKSRIGGSNPPLSAIFYKGIRDDDSRIDSRNSNPFLSRPVPRIVTAWAKLPAPLKAAILAIINSAEGQP